MLIEWHKRDKIIIFSITLATIISLFIFDYHDYFKKIKNTNAAKRKGKVVNIDQQIRSSGKIHSDFYLSNDSCATCHGNQKISKAVLSENGSITLACVSCHDGTVYDTYNIIGGYVSGTSGKRAMGGLFGTTEEGIESLSRHNLNSLLNSGAPGGNRKNLPDNNGSWKMIFECSSCHEPHDIYKNYRILNPNVNDIAVKNKVVSERLTSNKERTVFKALRGKWVDNFPQTYKIYIDGQPAELGTFIVDRVEGKVTFYKPIPQKSVVSASYYPGLSVTGQVVNYLSQSESAQYFSGVNQFCGACHTDYDTSSIENSSQNLSGSYTRLYRHEVGNNFTSSIETSNLTGFNEGQVTCLTCHVAHGADEKWWSDWAVDDGWRGEITPEFAGDSNLKKLPNMSTCEACHQMGLANYSYN